MIERCSIRVIVIVVFIILMASSYYHVLVSKVILVSSNDWGLGLPIATAGHANVTRIAIRQLQNATAIVIANCHD